MSVIFLLSLAIMTWSEQKGNPNFGNAGVSQSVTSSQSGGNMEGKEVRFGAYGSALFRELNHCHLRWRRKWLNG